MLKPRVVNLLNEQFEIYIGRAIEHPTKGKLPQSKWANPFKITRDEERPDAVEKYRQHVLRTPELLNSLPTLAGQTLGCWCDPKLCHGHVLADMVAALHPNPISQLKAMGVRETEERGKRRTLPQEDADALEWAIEAGALSESVAGWQDVQPWQAAAFILRDVGEPERQPALL